MSKSGKQDYQPKPLRVAEIALAMPDEFPAGYAEYLAEKESK